MRNRKLAVVPDRPQRYVAYIRVSALMGRGGDDFHSPEVQLAAIRRRTAGLQEVEVVDCDIDKPGTTFERRGIDRVMALAAERAIDVLAVYNIKRFGRNTLEGLRTLQKLAKLGVTIISAKERIDTSTAEGRKHLTDLLSLAQQQSEEIGEVWADVIEQRALSGEQHGKAAAGYRRVDKKLVIDPVLGPVMRECFRLFGIGKRMKAIAEYYHAQTGKTVYPSNLKERFRNVAYRGEVHHHGEVLPGNHEALVDDETWARCQARLANEKDVPPRLLAGTWALAGLLFCPCGRRLQRFPVKRRDGGREDRLVCGGVDFILPGSPCKGIGRPLLDRIEKEVLSQIEQWIAEIRGNYTGRAAEFARKAAARADVATLERELKRNTDAQTKLTVEHALDPRSDRAVHRAAMAELTAAGVRLQDELDRAKRAGDTPLREITANAAEAMLSMWDEMTVDEQARTLRGVVDRVTVVRARYYREPEDQRVSTKFL